MDDENDCDGLQCCFSLSLVRSRLLSNESGDDEVDRSLLPIAANNGNDFISNDGMFDDGDGELLVTLCEANSRAGAAELKFDIIDEVDGE